MDRECFHEWQYLVPDIQAGLIEIHNPVGFVRDLGYVRYLLRRKLGRKRLRKGTEIFPYYSLGGMLLRERAIEEDLPIDDWKSEYWNKNCF